MARRLLDPHIDRMILEECLRQATKRGISGISTLDIAAKLSISEPVIFAHFKDKRNLIGAAFLLAWEPFAHPGQIPFIAFPNGVGKTNEEDNYRAIKKAMRYKKELVFLIQYHSSPLYFDYDLVYDAFRERRETVVSTILSVVKPASGLRLDLIANLYIRNYLELLTHLAKGEYICTPDNVSRLANGLLYGVKGYLTTFRK